MATCSYDENFEQNEWLITPVLDISGQQTETHFIFDFNTVYAFTTHYKRCDLLVMASVDGGETWEKLWDLWDVGVFADWTNTQAQGDDPGEVPEQAPISSSPLSTCRARTAPWFPLTIVIVYADLVEDYAATTACAGENGSVSPEGRVLVKKGNSKTITVTPDEGYRIASVTVDGVDMGPISYYTFERIGVDHTITAAFAPSTPGDSRCSF
ncbi:MAG: InlB B-repeat-containing protein [Oscillospiraceae bacterium]